MVCRSGRSTLGSHPSHHDLVERNVEVVTYDPKMMRLVIKITVFLEILTSCFLGSEMVRLGEWASQPSRTPLNRNPSGWRTEGKFAGLAMGMPNVSSTGLEGERSCSRAERSADLGLDDEMLRAKGSSLIASEEPPGLEDRRARLSHLQASSSFSGPAGLERIDAPPTPRRPSVIRRAASNGRPGCSTRHTARKRLTVSPRGYPWGFSIGGVESAAPGGSYQDRPDPHTDWIRSIRPDHDQADVDVERGTDARPSAG